MIAEFDASNNMLMLYMHGLGTDDPWAESTGSAVGSGNTKYLYPNYQGSIFAQANGSGANTDIYAYGPYGEPLVKNVANTNQVTESFWGTRFRYTGQTTIPEAQLYYYKARVYDPNYGRFLQTDPIGSKDDLNLYGYVKGDPVNFSDPTGLIACCSSAGYHENTSEPKRQPVWPVAADRNGNVVITDDFNSLRDNGTRLHAATDFRNPEGGEVFAPQDGTVSRVYNSGDSGNSIIISNDDGTTNGFSHTAAADDVKAGTTVTAGQVIGTSDGSGAGPPHTHMTYRDASGTRQDPQTTQFKDVAGSCMKGTPGCP